MLATRLATVAVLVPLVLAALFLLSPLGFAAAALAVFVAAASEWAALSRYGVAARLLFAGAVAAAGVALLVVPAAGFDGGWPGVVVFLVCGAAALFWLLLVPPWLHGHWAPDSGPGIAVAGVVVLLGAWVALVSLQARSPWLVLAAMAVVWVADTAAYFAGRAFGRHKLAPAISPGKTWEGVAGALVAVAAYALALTPLAGAAGYAGALSVPVVAAWVAFALVLAALSVAGDLFESLLKRHAGVKDSGRLLPGHGGILDRIDALLAAMPAAAIAALWFLR